MLIHQTKYLEQNMTFILKYRLWRGRVKLSCKNNEEFDWRTERLTNVLDAVSSLTDAVNHDNYTNNINALHDRSGWLSIKLNSDFASDDLRLCFSEAWSNVNEWAEAVEFYRSDGIETESGFSDEPSFPGDCYS